MNIKIKFIEVFCNTDEHSYMKNEIANAEAQNPSRNFCQKNAEPQNQNHSNTEVFSVFN